MNPVELFKGFGRFWYDFVVGDDWVVAVGVVVALAITYGLKIAPDVPAWWLLPIVIVALIAVAVWRANARET